VAEVCFRVSPQGDSQSEIRLRNCSDAPMAFKIKCTSPKQYRVDPVEGVIAAGGEQPVKCFLQRKIRVETGFQGQEALLLLSHTYEPPEGSPESFVWNAHFSRVAGFKPKQRKIPIAFVITDEMEREWDQWEEQAEEAIPCSPMDPREAEAMECTWKEIVSTAGSAGSPRSPPPSSDCTARKSLVLLIFLWSSLMWSLVGVGASLALSLLLAMVYREPALLWTTPLRVWRGLLGGWRGPWSSAKRKIWHSWETFDGSPHAQYLRHFLPPAMQYQQVRARTCSSLLDGYQLLQEEQLPSMDPDWQCVYFKTGETVVTFSSSCKLWMEVLAGRSDATVAQAMDLVAALHTQFPENKVTLVGWSVGGIVALRCCTQLAAHTWFARCVTANPAMFVLPGPWPHGKPPKCVKAKSIIFQVQADPFSDGFPSWPSLVPFGAFGQVQLLPARYCVALPLNHLAAPFLANGSDFYEAVFMLLLLTSQAVERLAVLAAWAMRSAVDVPEYLNGFRRFAAEQFLAQCKAAPVIHDSASDDVDQLYAVRDLRAKTC